MTDQRKDEILTARMHLENFNMALGNGIMPEETVQYIKKMIVKRGWPDSADLSPPVPVEDHNLGDKIEKEARDILKAVVGLSWDRNTKTITMTPDSFVMCVYQASLPLSMPPVPVDTINIKKEVLLEMRHWINKFYEHKDEFYLGEALASLDAVLGEGE